MIFKLYQDFLRGVPSLQAYIWSSALSPVHLFLARLHHSFSYKLQDTNEYFIDEMAIMDQINHIN